MLILLRANITILRVRVQVRPSAVLQVVPLALKARLLRAEVGLATWVRDEVPLPEGVRRVE